MIAPRVLAQGEFNPSDILVSFTEQSNRKIDPEVESQIDSYWQKVLDDAKEKGKNIWNGISYRVDDFEITKEGKLKVTFSPIEFKTREGLITTETYYLLSEEHYRKGAFVSSLVRTRDGYYVFVQLSGLSHNKSKVELLGGIVGDSMDVRSGEDLFTVLYQELNEEAIIAKKDIQTCILQLIFINLTTNIGFHFDVQLSITKEQVEKQFQEGKRDVDIKDLLFVHETNLQKQMQSMATYKPFLYETLFN
jgi:hypothetical protein